MIYSVIKKEPVLKISFDKIIQCLVYEEVCYALIENDSDGKIIQTILKINLKELVILKSFFFISNLKDIFIKKENK